MVKRSKFLISVYALFLLLIVCDLALGQANQRVRGDNEILCFRQGGLTGIHYFPYVCSQR